ncbi:aldehyde dehydrogenase family protein [Planosporangium thailandense]|uniref:Aldehyde dehydrogenase family protein n=1 Tax=Planosporangium thailandense TaxID=765197 RepID=A0ABX0XX86_9ACTN|nr:aldehyde dehydrogenase family protein [Planosporangium thailandense]NJC69985.1 aldehyde dehydrogenase family protein [Planosporangium thailandense]
MTGPSSHQAQPNWIAGQPVGSDDVLEVVHPWDGRLAGRVSLATPEQVETAVAGAYAVRGAAAALPAHVRADALTHVHKRLIERADEIARLITAESGKPLKWSRAEVNRAASVFRLASEEARRWSGELQRLDTDPGGAGRVAMIQRVPRGPVLGVAPFNFPLNLVAHKIAPAIAVGAPIVLKPAPKTPLSALLLGELLAETDLSAGMVSVVVVPNERAADLVADPRLPVVSFTGSGPVGWAIRDAVPRKHVTLELGGNAAAVVCPDWSSDADLDWAASRIATFANYQAGQSCVSVQRVLVDRSVADRFLDRLVAAVRALRTGDPWDETTDVGPLIDLAAAERVEEWVREAVTAGATLLTGGMRDGATVAPTVLADVPVGVKLSCEEVFGPVLTVATVDGVTDAFAAVNDSRYGLQAGVFTHDLRVAFRAQVELEVGGVIVGDVPSYRGDQMPYGGVKESGVGREGVRSAMEDLTHEKVMVLAQLS